METKFCTKCGIEKPATTEWFSRQRSGKDGLRNKLRQITRIGLEVELWQQQNDIESNTKDA